MANWISFVGATLFTYGGATLLYIVLVAGDASLVVLSIGGAFVWQLGITVAGFAWWLLPSSLHRTSALLLASVSLSVALIDAVRLPLYYMYCRAEVYWQRDDKVRHKYERHRASFAIGWGSAVAQALITQSGVIVESLAGPGTIECMACRHLSIYVSSSIFSLLYIVFHVGSTVALLDALRCDDWPRAAAVGALHMLASTLSVINAVDGTLLCLVPMFAMIAIDALLLLYVYRLVFTRTPLYIRVEQDDDSTRSLEMTEFSSN
jgi:Aph-1 protein